MQISWRAARAGMVTGILLAMARIAGETAPLLFTALNNNFWFNADPHRRRRRTCRSRSSSSRSRPTRTGSELAWAGALLITVVDPGAVRRCAPAREEGDSAMSRSPSQPAAPSAHATADCRRAVRIAVRGTSTSTTASSTALKNINLDFHDRQVTALIGPSGCGKSTLLRTFNRIYSLYPEQRAEGEILLDGHEHPVARDRRERAARARRHGVPEADAVPDVDLRQRRLRHAPLREALARRARRPRRGAPCARRRCGTRSRTSCASPAWASPAASSSACASRAPSRSARGVLLRRADLGARSDLDRQDRGADRAAARPSSPSSSSPTTCSRRRASRSSPPSCISAS